MDKKDVKTTIGNILDNSYIGTMATISGGRPNSRYMTFFHDNMKLYTITSKKRIKSMNLRRTLMYTFFSDMTAKALAMIMLNMRGKSKKATTSS